MVTTGANHNHDLCVPCLTGAECTGTRFGWSKTALVLPCPFGNDFEVTHFFIHHKTKNGGRFQNIGSIRISTIVDIDTTVSQCWYVSLCLKMHLSTDF